VANRNIPSGATGFGIRWNTNAGLAPALSPNAASLARESQGLRQVFADNERKIGDSVTLTAFETTLCTVECQWCGPR
jgi:hypothetical protein